MIKRFFAVLVCAAAVLLCGCAPEEETGDSSAATSTSTTTTAATTTAATTTAATTTAATVTAAPTEESVPVLTEEASAPVETEETPEVTTRKVGGFVIYDSPEVGGGYEVEELN